MIGFGAFPANLTLVLSDLAHASETLLQQSLSHPGPTTLAVVFVGGLLASLGPCSLSLLPVTLAYLAGFGAERGPSPWQRSVSFAAGIVASLVLCLVTWYVIERTKLGSYLRAATENPALVQSFGINVPRMITLTYGFGVGLAALGGVMAAPIYQVSPQMGADLIIVVFAVVVIGGMGSILGSILTGFGLGLIEGLTKVFYPEASNTVIFVIMAIVLLIKPAGLFGTQK
jgi:branched-subunit amino acid ABC-type transport system permease component